MLVNYDFNLFYLSGFHNSDDETIEVDANLRKFCSKMNDLRNDEKYCDVEICIGDRKFPCHRVVLASASEYFDIMFGGNFKERDTAEVFLDNVDADAFEEILNFMYTGKTTVTSENAYRLLSTSEYLGVQYVEDLCIAYVMNNLSIHNGIQIFLYACKVGNKFLIETMSEYFAKNLVSESKKLLELPVHVLPSILKHSDLTKGDAIADFLCRWTKKDFNNRKKLLPDLLELVSSKDISVSCLAKLVLHEGNCTSAETNSTSAEKDDNVDSKLDSALENTIVNNSLLELYVQHADSSINMYTINGNNKCRFIKKLCINDEVDVCNIRTVTVNEQYSFSFTFNSKRNHFYYWLDFVDYKLLSLSTPPVIFPNYDLTVVDKTIYLYNPLSSFTGSGVRGRTSSRLWAYNCDIDKWFSIINPSEYDGGISLVYRKVVENVRKACLASSQNLLYVLGGVTDDDSTRRKVNEHGGFCACYDQRCGKWNTLGVLSQQHANAGACTMDGKIYISGGENLSYYSGSIEVYDQYCGEGWIESAPMPLPKKGHRLIPYKHKLWAVGGDDNDLSVFVYYPSLNIWTNMAGLLSDEVSQRTVLTKACVIDALTYDYYYA